METKDLPEEIKKLKQDLKQRVMEFNNKTDLNISGVMIEAQFEEVVGIEKPVVKRYEIGVNIEL